MRISINRLTQTYLLLLAMTLPTSSTLIQRMNSRIVPTPESSAERYNKNTKQYLRDRVDEVEYVETSGRTLLRRFKARVERGHTPGKTSRLS